MDLDDKRPTVIPFTCVHSERKHTEHYLLVSCRFAVRKKENVLQKKNSSIKLFFNPTVSPSSKFSMFCEIGHSILFRVCEIVFLSVLKKTFLRCGDYIKHSYGDYIACARIQTFEPVQKNTTTSVTNAPVFTRPGMLKSKEASVPRLLSPAN